MKFITHSLASIQTAALFLTLCFGQAGMSAATVPFHGSLQGTYLSLSGEDPAILVASGKASHLGRFVYNFIGHVTPDASAAFGTVEFVAANGDKLFGTFTGEATSIVLPILWIEEEITITGGTGRFAGVSGSVLLTRSVDVTDGSTAGSFDGELVK